VILYAYIGVSESPFHVSPRSIRFFRREECKGSKKYTVTALKTISQHDTFGTFGALFAVF